jgi:hypothetical protein
MKTYSVASAGLFCQFSGQHEPQPVYIYIDCEKETLSANYDSHIGGGCSSEEYHGHTQRFGTVPAISTEMNSFLKSEQVQQLANEIIDGYYSEWDGRNEVAKFTEDAQKAIKDLQQLIDNQNFTEVTYCTEDYMLADIPNTRDKRKLKKLYKEIVEQCETEFKEVEYELDCDEFIEKVIELNTKN